MLASITPLGERGRRNRWELTVAAYELGSLAGGAAMGVTFGALGLALRETLLSSTMGRAVLAAAVTVSALLLEVAHARGRLALPTVGRQVDKAWLDRYRGWVYGAGFGVQLGAGLVTIVNSAATYALVGVILVLGSPLGGLVVGGAFGLARALPLLVFGRAADFAGLQRAHRRLERLGRQALAGTLAALAAASIALVAVSVAASAH